MTTGLYPGVSDQAELFLPLGEPILDTSDLGFARNESKMAMRCKQQPGAGLENCWQECEDKILVQDF